MSEAIWEESLCYRLLVCVALLWRESGLCRLLDRMEAAVRRWVQDSAVCAMAWRDGKLPAWWPDSVTCQLAMILLNLPGLLVRWIYRLGRPLFDGSRCFAFLSALAGRVYLLLGLLAAVMLVAPHDSWNNLYGLIGALLVTAVFYLGFGRRPGRRLDLARLGPYLTLYFGLIGVALLTSLSTHLSLRFFLFHVTALLITLLAVSSVRTYRQLETMCALAVAGLTVAALYGCWQGYTGVAVVASQQDMALNVGMPGRAYSFFDNPNNFAELLVMLMPLDLALFLNGKNWGARLLSAGSLLVCLAAIGYTYSRSGWIGLALAVLIFLALQNWRFVPLLILLGLCAVPLLPQSIYNRIQTIGNTNDTSTRYRFAIYENTRYLMQQYWYRGVGLGTDVMKQVFAQYPTMFDGNHPIHTHNNYLQVWAETGILGFAAYLAMLAYQVKTSFKAAVTAADKRVKRLLGAAFGAFCGILVIGLAEYTWFYPRNLFLYWFLFGILAAGIRLARKQPSQPQNNSTPRR